MAGNNIAKFSRKKLMILSKNTDVTKRLFKIYKLLCLQVVPKGLCTFVILILLQIVHPYGILNSVRSKLFVVKIVYRF